MSATSEKLQTYQKQGHLFHGSPNGNIKVLEPRPAKDVNPNQIFNSDTAVFATSLALAAIIFGAVPERERLPEATRYSVWYTSWKNDEVASRIPVSWKDAVSANIGYVYVLPSEPFTENQGTQYKSKVPVTPVEKVEVTLQDFLDLGGHVEWIEG